MTKSIHYRIQPWSAQKAASERRKTRPAASGQTPTENAGNGDSVRPGADPDASATDAAPLTAPVPVAKLVACCTQCWYDMPDCVCEARAMAVLARTPFGGVGL